MRERIEVRGFDDRMIECGETIAAPLVGGMLSAPLLSLFVIPAAYFLIRRRGAEASLAASLVKAGKSATDPEALK